MAGQRMTAHDAAALPLSARADRPAPRQEVVPQRHPSVRLVAGFAGFGAGSVNLSISSSIFSAGSGEPERVLAGALAGLWGAALLTGAVVFLAKDRPAGGRWMRFVLAAAAVAHLAAIAFPTPATSGLGLTQLSALLLTLMILASLGWLRRAAGERAAMRPGRLLLAAFAGALLVAGITTPGLAASTAGQYAVPHGGHGNLAPGGHHQR